jgi:hypothetical protein
MLDDRRLLLLIVRPELLGGLRLEPVVERMLSAPTERSFRGLHEAAGVLEDLPGRGHARDAGQPAGVLVSPLRSRKIAPTRRRSVSHRPPRNYSRSPFRDRGALVANDNKVHPRTHQCTAEHSNNEPLCLQYRPNRPRMGTSVDWRRLTIPPEKPELLFRCLNGSAEQLHSVPGQQCAKSSQNHSRRRHVSILPRHNRPPSRSSLPLRTSCNWGSQCIQYPTSGHSDRSCTPTASPAAACSRLPDSETSGCAPIVVQAHTSRFDQPRRGPASGESRIRISGSTALIVIEVRTERVDHPPLRERVPGASVESCFWIRLPAAS